MKGREESFHAIDIAKFYIHDKHDIVLTGSFRRSTWRTTIAWNPFTYTAELYTTTWSSSDWLLSAFYATNGNRKSPIHAHARTRLR